MGNPCDQIVTLGSPVNRMVLVDTKLCPKCDTTKSLSEFHRNNSRPDGQNLYCKSCTLDIVKAHRVANKARINERTRQRRAANITKARQQERERYALSLPERQDRCPGCNGVKLVRSRLCCACQQDAQVGSGHPLWKGGLRDQCPQCGGIKYRTSKKCLACARRRFGDQFHISARDYQRAFRRTPQGKHHVRAMNLKKYGLSTDQYEQMFKMQRGACASCGRPETYNNQFGKMRLAVDHDHATGRVRGLLCARCNRSLGLLGDCPETIKLLLDYCERHKEVMST